MGIIVYSLLWAMPPKPYSLMGIFLIMGIAGCISSTVSAAMRPEDLDAQLADLRAPLHHFRDKLNPQANALALALSLSLFLSEGLKQGQTPCPGASAPPQKKATKADPAQNHSRPQLPAD